MKKEEIIKNILLCAAVFVIGFLYMTTGEFKGSPPLSNDEIPWAIFTYFIIVIIIFVRSYLKNS